MTDREYVVPLRRGFSSTPRHRRTKKAITVLREFLLRHTKADVVRIGQYLNEYLWQRGMRNPPPRVKIHVGFEEVEGKKIANAELIGKEFTLTVKPEEKIEEATGLKGKLQQATGVLTGKKADKKEEKKEVSKSKEEESENRPEKPTSKAPANALKTKPKPQGI